MDMTVYTGAVLAETAENETLQVEVERLQMENETLQVEVERLQMENETLQMENETLQVEVEKLQMENKTLQVSEPTGKKKGGKKERSPQQLEVLEIMRSLAQTGFSVANFTVEQGRVMTGLCRAFVNAGVFSKSETLVEGRGAMKKYVLTANHTVDEII